MNERLIAVTRGISTMYIANYISIAVLILKSSYPVFCEDARPASVGCPPDFQRSDRICWGLGHSQARLQSGLTGDGPPVFTFAVLACIAHVARGSKQVFCYMIVFNVQKTRFTFVLACLRCSCCCMLLLAEDPKTPQQIRGNFTKPKNNNHQTPLRVFLCVDVVKPQQKTPSIFQN